MYSRRGDALLEDILYEVEECEGFLREDMSLDYLSRAVASNRSYVSACINRYTGMSFTGFINSYKVKYAQELMSDEDNNLDIKEVRYLCRFSSESTFVRNFRKYTGCTPSEWLLQREKSALDEGK